MMIDNFKDISVIDDVERMIILRKRLRIKQYELARAIGVTANYLGDVENYKLAFTPKLVKRLNEYLKRVELEQLEDGQDSHSI
ncbi:helix-turn-helix domain-containing protein [Bacillus salitolerans]|uniref:Helix-turn-helix domain-containing protein n=1 Tax=Bacillus salitolerans TaxID=1437434 RepID=A0ABW4LNJ1_9BACI